MATLLPNADLPESRLRGYRIFIFSHDHPQPPHIHFGKGRRYSSWDLTQLACRDPDGFSSQELAVQRTILREHHHLIWSAWHAYWQEQPNR